MKSKRGTVLDLLPLVVILLVFSLTILFSNTLWIEIAGTGSLNTTAQSTRIVANTTEQWGVFDYAFLAVVIGLSITSIIAAVRVRTSPLFFFLSIILLSIVLLVTYVAREAFTQAQGQLAGAASNFPIMIFVMDNLLLYAIIMGVAISIGLYSTKGGSDGGGVL